MPDHTLGDDVISKLSVHLGPNVARMAIRSFAKKAGVAGPETLTAEHVPALIDEIHPMLNVMIGRGPADAVIAEIMQACSRR